MESAVVVNDNNFEQLVLKAEIPVLVDFGADWCGPCRMLAPIIEELAGEYSSRISFVKLDIDQNPQTATKYGIRSIPTLLLFKKAEPISQIVGFKPKKELKQSLDAALSEK